MFAAANDGVYKSTNGGVSWTNYLAQGGFFDLVMDPTNPNILYASGAGTQGVYKSVNGGTSWTQLANAPHGGTSSGAFIAIAPSNPSRLIVTYWNDGTATNDYISNDAGTTWTVLTGVSTYGGMSNVMFDPNNADVAYMGSTWPFLQTRDGGATWHEIQNNSDGTHDTHWDHHGWTFDAAGRLWEGNDHGVSILDNNIFGQQHWTEASGNITDTLMGRIALDPSNREIAYAGFQDNGTVKFTGSTRWTNVMGGDGEQTLVNPLTPSTVYGSYQLFGIQRSYDGGKTWTFLADTAHGFGASETVEWNMPNRLDPSNPDRVLVPTTMVYQSLDRGDHFTAISTPNVNGWNSTGTIRALAIAPNDSNTIFAATYDGLEYTHNNGATWTTLKTSGVTTAVADIAFDPANANTIYIARDQTSGNMVSRSLDGGATWTNITSNLPLSRVNAIAIDPLTGTIFAGTNFGLYATMNGGTTWFRYNMNMANNLRYLDLEVRPELNIVAAGSFSQGLWELSFPLSGSWNMDGGYDITDNGIISRSSTVRHSPPVFSATP